MTAVGLLFMNETRGDEKEREREREYGYETARRSTVNEYRVASDVSACIGRQRPKATFVDPPSSRHSIMTAIGE